jgi:hypothetical protein
MKKLIIISVSLLLSFGFVAQSAGQTLSKKQTELIQKPGRLHLSKDVGFS